MATLPAASLTMADYARRQTSDGAIAPITEILAKQLPILDDVPWLDCNQGHENLTVLRTGLPTAYPVSPNGGYQLSKSQTAPIIDSTTRIGSCMEVDCLVADAYADRASFLASEASTHLEALNQEWARQLFYGDFGKVKTEITGLATRFSSLTGNQAMNILDAGGTGSDNNSVWFTVWGPSTLHGIVPKGTPMGLQHTRDKGGQPDTVILANGNRQQVYRDFFRWDCGIALRDWRSVVRIANVDTSNLIAESSAADLYKLMIKGFHRIRPVLGMGRPAIYMTRTAMEMLDIQSRNSQSYTLDQTTVEGKLVTSFRGIPIRVADSLSESEARVVA